MPVRLATNRPSHAPNRPATTVLVPPVSQSGLPRILEIPDLKNPKAIAPAATIKNVRSNGFMASFNGGAAQCLAS